MIPATPGYAYMGHRIVPVLEKKLIDPKIVTGDITSLVISDTDSDELPDSMVSKFRSESQRLASGIPIEGPEALYKVFGTLKLGSKIARVACALHLAPHKKLVYGATVLDYRAYFQKFPQQGLNDEVAAWTNAIEESRTREAEMRLHPWSGGAMNPR